MPRNGTKPLVPVNRLPKEEAQIVIRPPEMRQFKIRVEGKSPLVIHGWGSKMLKMQEAQEGKGPRRSKAPKDKVAEYEDARYRLPDGRDGVKALAFKRAIEQAAADDDAVTKSAVKWQVFVNPGEELLPILNTKTGRYFSGKHGTKDAPDLYTAEARVGPMRVADVRHRPKFFPWAVDLVIEYRADRYTEEALCNLLVKAGYCGVGEERPTAPKASGQMGMFTISKDQPGR